MLREATHPYVLQLTEEDLKRIQFASYVTGESWSNILREGLELYIQKFNKEHGTSV